MSTADNTAAAPAVVLGEVEVVRLIEWHGPFGPAAAAFPDIPPHIWRDNADWLVPDHYEAEHELAVLALQTWLLRSAGRTVLVDTGMGDGHPRPGSPPFDRWQGGLLDRLRAVGVTPGDVDVVVNTHLHVDHIGGNTVEADPGEWVPAFPNAQYLIARADDAFFGPGNAHGAGTQDDGRLVYEDSVAPLHRAGQTVLWEDSYRIDENLTLEAAPGHTPGSSVLSLRSGPDRALFVGDLIQSPAQLVDPACNSAHCVDPAAAQTSRRRLLDQAARDRAWIIPAHFGGAGAFMTDPDGGHHTCHPMGQTGTPVRPPR
ncbi:MBL fold metallo-hydrolase [Amycolatopsis sp. PS_44_ISF1]|uniref:MBL fold metallo-hydrolase n=1 Tax=Amycolatopsis sp. PS_44_ISF1 TaxID=2974917 RepID=UPI0028E071BE|nr:MBL fold metallo-hydrolase [Amycolatopsis sp. PS_44_ISF1]MDT8913614.1 MBL fold metallo-hydrolase [Amycolatopsis sp. PS_44_ISF1]